MFPKNYTLAQVSTHIQKKEISPVELTQQAFDTIQETDDHLGCFLHLCEKRALLKAKQVEQKILNNEPLSPIAGIPYALKDNICTEGIHTTCASKMLENYLPPYSATVFEKIEAADGILCGKNNMDEFAMGGSTENSAFQKTKNPWDLRRVPGGSSGGSAASVASRQVLFSLGSDTGGSIRQPAALCGVTGLKPTYGLISRYGLVAFASSLDQIGPLTIDVTDAALVLNALVGKDPRDATSIHPTQTDYTSGIQNGIQGLRIGVPFNILGSGLAPEVSTSLLQATKTFEALGATIHDIDLSITEYAIPTYYLLSSAEASSNLARYDGVKYGYSSPHSENLEELYFKTRSEGFGFEVKRRIMLGTYALSSGYYDQYYHKAQKARTLIKKSYQTAFQEVDVLLTPTSPTTAFLLGEKTADPLQMYLMDIFTVSVNIAGLPAISIPSTLDQQGLPIGIQLIGKSLDEQTLLRTAYSFEQAVAFHQNHPKGGTRK